jgi:prepilin-type N-terminal cleavage/methylation domain-containing protein
MQARPQKVVSRTTRARGFTLIETALATVIVGVGILALFQSFLACTYQNRDAAQMSTAMMLTTNIQEAMGGLSFCDPGLGRGSFHAESGEVLATFDDVDDFDGVKDDGQIGLCPPIDSLRQRIPELSQYTQVISVWPVYTNNLSVNSNPSSPDIPQATYTGAVRVRVEIYYRATASDPQEKVYEASWIRMDN